MQYLGKNRLTKDQYVNGLLAGDVLTLSKALSLVESVRKADRTLSDQVMEAILGNTGSSIRVGITGVPGVGKSTFIEALGLFLISAGHKVAVLTIDPSSQRTKGSILGDKTRMEQLSKATNAFIRPSAAGSNLGGVASHTRESVLLCEAAGYDVVIIETVGVGQSETVVRDMVDFFLLLLIAGAGDELQGIKKGIIEMADALAITKADGANLKQAKEAQAIYRSALHLLSPTHNLWQPPVHICSAEENVGIEKIWASIESYRESMIKSGAWDKQREEQRLIWMQHSIQLGIANHLSQTSTHSISFEHLKQQVKDGTLLPTIAASAILSQLFNENDPDK